MKYIQLRLANHTFSFPLIFSFQTWEWKGYFLGQKPLKAQVEPWESERGNKLIQEMGLDVCGNDAAPNAEKN